MLSLLKINSFYKIPEYNSIFQLLDFGISNNKNTIHAKLESLDNKQLLITRTTTDIQKWQMYP